MVAWVWPRMLALTLGVLLLMSACLQPASRWDPWLRAQSPVVLGALGVTVARPALIGSAMLLHCLPHAGWIRPGPVLQGMPELIQTWTLWPARAALHGAALALWLGLCSPVLLVYARGRGLDAVQEARPGAANPSLSALTTWPVWRRGLGSLPLATLLWSVTAPATLTLAPGLAVLWLLAAAALWWPLPSTVQC